MGIASPNHDLAICLHVFQLLPLIFAVSSFCFDSVQLNHFVDLNRFIDKLLLLQFLFSALVR